MTNRLRTFGKWFAVAAVVFFVASIVLSWDWGMRIGPIWLVLAVVVVFAVAVVEAVARARSRR